MAQLFESDFQGSGSSATTGPSKREDLADYISLIDAKDTPFSSMAPKGKDLGNMFHRWSVDSYEAAQTEGYKDGKDAANTGDGSIGIIESGASVTHGAGYAPLVMNHARNRDELSNFAQYFRRATKVSPLAAEVTNPVGGKNLLAQGVAKKTVELKRDMEKTILGNVAQNAGAAGSARLLGSIQTWLLTNYVTEGTGGSPAGPVGGNGTATRTSAGSGNYGAFEESKLKECVKSVFENGGNPTMLVVPPTQKQVVSGFAGIAAQRYEAPKNAPTTIIGAADVYLSDFGTLSVVPDRFMTADGGTGSGEQALVLDPTMASVATLRPFESNLLAKTGDSEKHQMLVEYTLQVSNEKAHGIVADLLVS